MCVVFSFLCLELHPLTMSGLGVNTASGLMDYDGLAERDITFILLASQ